MAKDNPMNPYTRDENKTRRDMPSSFSKARVEAVDSHPAENGYHTARIRLYGEDTATNAAVIPPMIGGAYIPREGEDVAVIFDSRDNPWVIGGWYPFDRVENGEVDIPEYEAGEVVIGNHTGSHIRFDNSGDIHIESVGDVFINGEKQ